MLHWHLILFFFSLASAFNQVSAQAPVTIAGQVTNAKTSERLAGVNVYVKGKVTGTSTDSRGAFSLTTTTAAPFALVFSIVGFTPQEVVVSESRSNLNISLSEAALLGSEVVVSASRVEESILRSPVSVEKLDSRAIRETPAANFYDGLQNLKTVDMITTSLGFKIVNTRGFMSTSNNRFVQFIDGMDNQAPGLNLPLGNLVGLSDLDAEGVEIIPGAASALYGPNAFNGVLSMTSKNPFDYQGFSAMVRLGVNHINDSEVAAKPMYEAMFRYAKAYRNRFAFKVNLAYMTAHDWHANSTENVDPLTFRQPGTPATNPAYNALNVYGDEAVTSLPIGAGGAPVRVARTGYNERDLVDYDTYSLKADAALHYRLSEKAEAIYQYKFGAGTSVYQGANRYAIKNFRLQQHKLELKGAHFFARAYATLENAGDSYDSRFLALNLNRAWKSDQQWFQEYAVAYLGLFEQQGITPGDHAVARNFADRGRLVPGTAEYDRELTRIAGTPDFRVGAQFKDQTKMYHTEGQYDFSQYTGSLLDVQVGGSYRLYDLNSDGTIFSDTTGNDITMYEYGAYVQGSRMLLKDRLKITGSVRYDKNENFDGRFTPRASAVFSLAENHHFRTSFQTGFRNPTTQDQFIFLNVGQAILVGGVPSNSSGLNLYGPGSNSIGLSAVQQFGTRVAQAVASGAGSAEAVLQNTAVLQPATVAYVQPEQVQAYEIGYKSLLFNKSLLADLNYYYSTYQNFILSTTVVQTQSDIRTEPQAAAFDVALGRYQPYQLYTNAAQRVSAQGAAIGLTYSYKGYSLGGNANWNKLDLGKNVDPDQVPAFNTPEWKYNLLLSNRDVYNNIGFALTYRWSGSYNWQSAFIAGINEAIIPSYSTLDAQVSYKMPALKSILKVGGSNVTNKRFRQVYGGPTIGALYYVSFTFDELLN
ncbi:TonB-dependent receptor [Pontibacter qinzhouensis]|uniref:TonB-dependent receptor n=2 Tax=Pontibacter qinzhouensis TaxID=2603253 RepID=A0A5C8KD97_9BACT|nr:TonB-dependent receptor [Pontibacter qinzhouensis]